MKIFLNKSRQFWQFQKKKRFLLRLKRDGTLFIIMKACLGRFRYCVVPKWVQLGNSIWVDYRLLQSATQRVDEIWHNQRVLCFEILHPYNFGHLHVDFEESEHHFLQSVIKATATSPVTTWLSQYQSETSEKTKRKTMSGQVNIELGELTNSDQPSETTRFTPDDSQRYIWW